MAALHSTQGQIYSRQMPEPPVSAVSSAFADPTNEGIGIDDRHTPLVVERTVDRSVDFEVPTPVINVAFHHAVDGYDPSPFDEKVLANHPLQFQVTTIHDSYRSDDHAPQQVVAGHQELPFYPAGFLDHHGFIPNGEIADQRSTRLQISDDTDDARLVCAPAEEILGDPEMAGAILQRSTSPDQHKRAVPGHEQSP